jgi:hypothetical protein
MKTLLSLSILLLLQGCCLFHVKIDNIPDDRIIMIDEDGKLQDPKAHDCGRHDRFTKHETFKHADRMEHIDKVVNAIVDGTALHGDTRRVMIYIHGGVGTEIANLKKTVKINNCIESDNATAGIEKIYPVFINWRSSLAKSYNDYVLLTRQGERSWWYVWQSPFIFTSDAVKSVLQTPGIVLQGSVDFICSWFDADSTEKIGLHEGADLRNKFDTTVNGFTYSLFLPIRIVTVPLIGLFAPGAWHNMRRNTTMLFYRSRDYLKEGENGDIDEEKNSEKKKKTPEGALSLFLDRFLKKIKEMEQTSEDSWEITLIGHSMGTIVLNKIIHRYPDLPVKNIVYMAAACSVQEYHDAVIGRLKLEQRREVHTDSPEDKSHSSTQGDQEQRKEIQVYHLVLHNKAETEERLFPDHFYLDVAHRGSLLVWLDTFITKPETLFDRTAGRFENLVNCLPMTPPGLKSHIHIKQFDYGPAAEDLHPQDHGDFNEFTFWRHAFRDLHSEGVGYKRMK